MLDALDRSCAAVVDSCAHLMPLQDKTAAINMNAASLDFQWLTGEERLKKDLIRCDQTLALSRANM